MEEHFRMQIHFKNFFWINVEFLGVDVSMERIRSFIVWEECSKVWWEYSVVKSRRNWKIKFFLFFLLFEGKKNIFGKKLMWKGVEENGIFEIIFKNIFWSSILLVLFKSFSKVFQKANSVVSVFVDIVGVFLCIFLGNVFWWKE